MYLKISINTLTILFTKHGPTILLIFVLLLCNQGSVKSQIALLLLSGIWCIFFHGLCFYVGTPTAPSGTIGLTCRLPLLLLGVRMKHEYYHHTHHIVLGTVGGNRSHRPPLAPIFFLWWCHPIPSTFFTGDSPVSTGVSKKKWIRYDIRYCW